MSGKGVLMFMVSVSGTAVKLKNDDLVLDTSEKDIYSCEEDCKLN